jgi:anti-sigma B factor antagonist
MLTIEVEERGAVSLVRMAGSVDGLTAGDLLERLTAELARGRTRLVGSFADVEYTSSAVLTVLKDARGQGGDLRLAAVRREVYRVLDLAGFAGILKIYDDVDAAVASFAT